MPSDIALFLRFAQLPIKHFHPSNYSYSLLTLGVGCFGPQRFWPKLFSQPANRVVFSLAWAKSTMYATDASRFHGPKRLLYSNWEMGSVVWTLFNITFVIFANLTDLIICDYNLDLRIATGKCHTLNYIYIYIYI